MANICKVISLFSGGGGLDIALCEVVNKLNLYSTDSNMKFLSTIEENLTNHFCDVDHETKCVDAREFLLDNRNLVLGTDFVMGGPPCDDFTKTGLRKGLNGDKGPLIFEFCEIVNQTKPKVFLFENVPNLTTDWEFVFNDLLERFKAIGYHVRWKVLTACDYGAPTIRKRLFVIGFLDSHLAKEYRFPSPTHSNSTKHQLTIFENNNKTLPYVTVADVLSDLPDVKTNESCKYHNHTGRNHRSATIEHMKKVPQGKALRQSYRYRAPWDGQCRSLIAGLDNSTKSYLHPFYHREMSVREYARIHGFPDSWKFCGTHHNGIKQVANAVPVPLGRAVIKSISDIFKWSKG